MVTLVDKTQKENGKSFLSQKINFVLRELMKPGEGVQLKGGKVSLFDKNYVVILQISPTSKYNIQDEIVVYSPQLKDEILQEFGTKYEQEFGIKNLEIIKDYCVAPPRIKSTSLRFGW
ncbi:hypothetical protein HOD29_03495 [archaeon]|jgi:hypothetical protein|nr:hypothetical protein [archaeon]